MIGFQFIVEQIVPNRPSNWPYETYGLEGDWNKTPNQKGYFTTWPKFQLPERTEQYVEPPVSNKYAAKYGYSKMYFTPSYFNLPDDLSTADIWDPKYSPNYSIKAMKYCGIYTLRMNEKIAKLKDVEKSNVSTKIYNYNSNTIKSIFDKYDPNILNVYTNSSDISLRNTNRMNSYLKDKGISTNTLNLIPEEDFEELLGNKQGSPSYLIFTHARTGWRLLFNIDYNYKGIYLVTILKPDGSLYVTEDGYSTYLNNTTVNKQNLHFMGNNLKFINGAYELSDGYNYTNDKFLDKFYYSGLMFSYYNINYDYSLKDNTDIILTNVIMNDDKYYGSANRYSYGSITRDNIEIKGIYDEIYLDDNRKFIIYNSETQENEVFNEANVDKYWDKINYDTSYGDVRFGNKIYAYYLLKLFKEIKYPDIWDNHEESGIDDPYEEGGNSVEGGGNGSFDDKNESIDSDFNLDGIISSITNSIKIWKPSQTQLNTLMSVLTSKTFLDAIINWTSGFEKYLISLNVLPVNVPTANKAAVSFRTQILCSDVPYVTNTIINKDMGSILVEPYYGNAVDYKSTFDLFLPFIGNKRIQAEDVIDKVLSIKYTIDVITGACVARVYSDGTCRYEFSGNCAYTIPLNVESYNSTIQSLLLATSSIAGAAATGGASIIGTIGASSAANLAMNVGNKDMKFRGNGGTGNAAYLGTNYPYLTITRLNMSNPSEYNKFYGYPSNITEKIGNLSGYTIIDRVHLEGISATQQEIDEIEQLLKGGVIC